MNLPVVCLAALIIKDAMETIGLVSGSVGLVVTVLTFASGGTKAVINGFAGLGRILWLILTPLHGIWSNASRQKKLEKQFSDYLTSTQRDSDTRNVQCDACRVHIAEAGEALAKIKEIIEKEFKFNGGSSIKDILSLLYADYKETKRNTSFPLFICDEKGRNIVVSKPYADLLDLENDGQLLGLEWRSFIDGRDMREYSEGFFEAVANCSSFGGRFRFSDSSKGAWAVRAQPLLRGQDLKLLYLGVIRPSDDTARSIAEGKGYDYSTAPH